jgi:hypothetical protein
VEAKVMDAGRAILKLVKHQEFPEFYLGVLNEAFSKKGLLGQLQNSSHAMWHMINQAEIAIVKEDALDSFFMDETIMDLVPESARGIPTVNWPEAVIKKFYKSGILPETFHGHF